MWSVVRAPTFRRYLLGLTATAIGTWSYQVTASVLVFRLTGSALLVGVVTSAQFVGTVLLVPWSGSAADRFDRRRLLVSLQLFGAVVSGALALAAFLDVVTAGMVIVASVLLGLGLAFNTPALHAMIPQLVASDEIDVAVAANSLVFNFARAVGPVLAAAVIAVAGVSAALVVNTMSFVFFAIALASLRPRSTVYDRPERTSFFSSFREMWLDREIRLLLVAVAAVSISIDPATTLAPAFVADVFRTDEAATGVVVAAFGLGAVVAAMAVVPRLASRPWALGACLVATGIGILGFAVAPNLWVSLVPLALAGGGFLCAVSRATGRLHRSVPDHRLGRLMAIWSLAFLGTRPAAALVDGALADGLGPRHAAAILSLPALALGAALLRRGEGRPT